MMIIDAEFFFVVFSNILKDTQIHVLADSDEQEIVQQVQVLAFFWNVDCQSHLTSFIIHFYNKICT